MRDVSAALALNRRTFIQSITGATISSALGSRLRAASNRFSKAVVVTFGGGARDDETFSLAGQQYIPRMLAELAPQATFYSQVVNRGILGHYVANASLASGVYERINNFTGAPPQNPTVFEYFRKDLNRPASDVWVIAPSIGFDRIGESSHRAYGGGTGAGVILPKRLLASVVGPGGHTEFDHLLHDNYETPLHAPEMTRDLETVNQLSSLLKLSVDDFTGHARMLSSPDELSVFIARRLMKQYAPSLLWITLHDIDIAHTGTYSLYLDAIRRTDRLCAELWQAIRSEPEYTGKTGLFVLPDFGRDGDDSLGGNGFQHHRTGDALSRTTWLMALGPGIRENTIVGRPVESLDLVPTLGSFFGFSPRLAQGKLLSEIL